MSEFLAGISGVIVGGLVNFIFLKYQLEFKDARQDKSLRLEKLEAFALDLGEAHVLAARLALKKQDVTHILDMDGDTAEIMASISDSMVDFLKASERVQILQKIYAPVLNDEMRRFRDLALDNFMVEVGKTNFRDIIEVLNEMLKKVAILIHNEIDINQPQNFEKDESF